MTAGLAQFFPPPFVPVEDHPAVRRWRARIDNGAKLTLRLEEDEEDGFLYFEVFDGDEFREREDWDLALDDGLVMLGVRAVDWKTEAGRFMHRLFHRFSANVADNGIGFFYSVLVDELKKIGAPNLSEILEEVHKRAPDTEDSFYESCRNSIREVIAHRAAELVTNLGYSLAEAEPILERALVLYIDVKYSASKRRVFGFLR